MQIKLPDIDIMPDWTIASQIKKILEEAGEVAEAIALNDPVNTIREALDTMQTCATLINMVVAERSWSFEEDIDLGNLIEEHNEKLIRKGYLKPFVPLKHGDSVY